MPHPESHLSGSHPRGQSTPAIPLPKFLEVASDQGIQFRIDWHPTCGTSTVQDATHGSAVLAIAGDLVWGGRDGSRPPVNRSWFELLRFLADTWCHLKWEPYPFGLQPREPASLRRAAEERWDGLGAEQVRVEEQAVAEFERRHDLARGLPEGDPLPSLWLIREGNHMRIQPKNGAAIDRPAAEVLEQLAAIGDAIAQRAAAFVDPAAREVVARWNRRDERSPMELASIATGLSPETIRWVASNTPESEGLDLDAAHGDFQLTEVLAAARMLIGALEPAAVMSVIECIVALPKSSTTTLDEWSDQAEAQLHRRSPGKPYEEGYALAYWLRTRLNLATTQPVEPDQILDQLGVPIQSINVKDDRLDALACWGPRHGPAVVVNQFGRHSQTEPGRRATLAHELCHLLIDREGALPLVEILNGRAPARVEARARAFAAELLLPRRYAGAAARDEPDLEAAVDRLRSEFAVSREIAIRQMENARENLPLTKQAELERMRSSLDGPA